jgi:hypothetical protein
MAYAESNHVQDKNGTSDVNVQGSLLAQKIGRRNTDKSLIEPKNHKQSIRYTTLVGQNVYIENESPKQRGMLHPKSGKALGRLGHNLRVREDLAGFVVALAYARDILPWLIGYIAVCIIQRNYVLHLRQKLKLAL